MRVWVESQSSCWLVIQYSIASYAAHELEREEGKEEISSDKSLD